MTSFGSSDSWTSVEAEVSEEPLNEDTARDDDWDAPMCLRW